MLSNLKVYCGSVAIEAGKLVCFSTLSDVDLDQYSDGWQSGMTKDPYQTCVRPSTWTLNCDWPWSVLYYWEETPFATHIFRMLSSRVKIKSRTRHSTLQLGHNTVRSKNQRNCHALKWRSLPKPLRCQCLFVTCARNVRKMPTIRGSIFKVSSSCLCNVFSNIICSSRSVQEIGRTAVRMLWLIIFMSSFTQVWSTHRCVCDDHLR